MKQGTLVNRIMMLVLLAAVVLCLAVSAWRSFRNPYTLVPCYAYTVDDTLEATGFLVREELVLSAASGEADVLPEEGEKVARGETVALFYQDGQGAERRQELESLNLEREQLEYALERAQTGGDPSQLTEQVLDAIAGLRASAASGDLTHLEEQTQNLKALVYKREYTFSGGEGEADPAPAIQASLDAVEARISALTAQAAQSTARLTAQEPGVFSGHTDGFERLLTPDMLEDITSGELAQLARRQPEPEAGAVGKLITDATWYFVFSAPQAEAERLVEGRSASVRFSRDWSGEGDMTVERGGEPEENGQCVVVLSTDRYLSDTTLLRRQTVELVFDSQEGIRVPSEAVRVVEQTVTDGETGEERRELITCVFVLVGQQAERKPVTILEQLEDFALVVPAGDASAREALRAGDEIILSAVELADGDVILGS